MRPSPALVFAALLHAGCACTPGAEDWLDVGFRGPEQAFGTFRTALGADEHDLAYRCLSEDLKRREGVVGMSFAIAWERMLSERPWLRRLSCGEIVASEPLASGGVTLRIAVDAPLWMDDVLLRVDMTPQRFRELWSGNQRVDDAFLGPGEGLHPTQATDGSTWVQAQQRVPDHADPAAITEARWGTDWKIDAFTLLDEH